MIACGGVTLLQRCRGVPAAGAVAVRLYLIYGIRDEPSGGIRRARRNRSLQPAPSRSTCSGNARSPGHGASASVGWCAVQDLLGRCIVIQRLPFQYDCAAMMTGIRRRRLPSSSRCRSACTRTTRDAHPTERTFWSPRPLPRHIFEHGIDGRFYSQVRKYHHQGGMVYWFMSPTPEGATLINRCRRTRPTRRG
jgi:hypothetical protein